MKAESLHQETVLKQLQQENTVLNQTKTDLNLKLEESIFTIDLSDRNLNKAEQIHFEELAILNQKLIDL